MRNRPTGRRATPSSLERGFAFLFSDTLNQRLLRDEKKALFSERASGGVLVSPRSMPREVFKAPHAASSNSR